MEARGDIELAQPLTIFSVSLRVHRVFRGKIFSGGGEPGDSCSDSGGGDCGADGSH
jgi:hypothetical protein